MVKLSKRVAPISAGPYNHGALISAGPVAYLLHICYVVNPTLTSSCHQVDPSTCAAQGGVGEDEEKMQETVIRINSAESVDFSGPQTLARGPNLAFSRGPQGCANKKNQRKFPRLSNGVEPLC